MHILESLKKTLSFYGVNCNEPYYISSGNPIFTFPKNRFRMDFYAFCICVSGSIDVEIENRQYNISNNGFLVAAPSTIVRFVHTSADFRMKLLFFDKHFLLKNISNPFFIEKMSLFGNQSFSIATVCQSDAERLLTLLDYLQQQTKRKGKYIDDIIRTIIINLLLETATIIELQPCSTEKQALEENNLYFRFHQLVQELATTHKNVQYYADLLCITSKYLINVVKKATGKTPLQIIDETILKEVYILLGNPEETILQIALEVGFNSASAFGRFFKKYVGITPMEYRKEQFS